jgi:response regulator RpfG family c-di-GMP phosphodiesterase
MSATDCQIAQTLLIVDDEARILSALKETLERQGFQVVACSHPRKALELVRQRPFGVILSDQLMPEMTGLEFLVECRRIQPLATRILVTALLSLPTIVEAINRGEIFRFIAKPWLREELIATMRNAATRYELLRQNERLMTETARLNQELSAANQALAAQVSQLESQRAELDQANRRWAESYDRSLELCSRIVGSYDPPLAAQTRALVEIARQLAAADSFSEDERQVLLTSAWYCDLGLIGVSRDVLRTFQQAPERLTERELEGIHNHPVYSQTLVSHIDPRGAVGETVRAHHERYDGRGFPDGRAGDAIPWTARCLAVAVRFVESDLPKAQAVERLLGESGRALDPAAVELFLQLMKLAPSSRRGREVEWDDLEPGMVLANGLYTPHGLLLFGEGQALSGSTIEKLRAHHGQVPLSQRVLVYS